MDTPWRIELLGGLRATRDDRVIARFQTQKTGALLAYLAYHCHRSYPRELLIELLWPESEPRAGRNKLSLALSSLRRQLEPPGVLAGAVIIANRAAVQLNPAAVRTDVAQFDAALRAAAREKNGFEQAQRLAEAIDLYGGELLPGSCEEWVLPERQRLAAAYLQALDQLTDQMDRAGNLPRALQYARRSVSADPLREESQHTLIRLLAAAGQPEGALRQYQDLERLLADELETTPAPETRALVQAIKDRQARTTVALVLNPPPIATPHSSAPVLPLTGTLTFLLIEHEQEEGWTRLRGLCQEFRGQEIPSASGALAAAFGRASDALAAAVAGQRALADHSSSGEAGAPRVRMALHTGEAQTGEESQRSPVLEHATWLLLAAHPGQILLTNDTATLLQREPAPGMQLVDLGLYRLQEAASPERLFQAHAPEMPRWEFPPPNALPAHPGHLPLQLTRFFGREAEIARLCSILISPPASREAQRTRRRTGEDPDPFNSESLRDLCVSCEAGGELAAHKACRLLTLTGLGGSGKTRLALEVAERLRTPFHGAVWFIPLQDLTDARLIPDKLLDVLRLPRSPQIEPIEQAAAFLSRQPSLLLLDNFEHLVEHGAPLVQTLLEQTPALTCLVTSRQRLNLAGEQEFPVAPLPVPTTAPDKTDPSDPPNPSDPTDPALLIQCPSVALFLDRAQATRPDFQLTRTNAAAVMGVCARLEGLPLALELAAARIGALAPAQILERLSQRFDLLATTRRGAAPRHRSLRAALEWSYQLLSPELQRFFARLSVFQGGWTLEAVEAVCDEPNALQYLEQLRECTLVQAAEAGGEMWFRLLETLREYGAEQLGSEEREAVAHRHASYYLAVAERADQVAWFERLERELDNLRAALAWLEGSRRIQEARRLGAALREFVTPVAGDGTPGYSGDSSSASQARLHQPSGPAFDVAGDLYIADVVNNRVRKVGLDGTITTVAGTGKPGFSGDGGKATEAQLSAPARIVLDGAGNLFFTDFRNHRVRKVTPDGIITTVAGRGPVDPISYTGGDTATNGDFSGDNGLATEARLSGPVGLAMDAHGNLFIGDYLNHRVRKIDAVTGLITTVAGNGQPVSSGDGGLATAAQLNGCVALIVDSAGNLFIADNLDNRVRKVTPDGIITTVAGNGKAGFSGDGGKATDARMNAPQGLAVDSAGTLFVADNSNSRVRMVSPEGIITTVAGNGKTKYAGGDGLASKTGLKSPNSLAIDAMGNLLIADDRGARLLKVLGVAAPGLLAGKAFPQ
jgi:predicted ATPase/DNA-binding SARP family transcriptional activator